MKLVVQVKLRPTAEQVVSLRATMVRANEACDWLSSRAWDTKVFRQFALHKLAYRTARAAFHDLSSQMIVRATAKVADGYKTDKKVRRSFRSLGSIAYDARILSWKSDPRNTSRECRVCGHIEKANRRTRDAFACLACGHTADADVNAACVIASRATVIRPHGSAVRLGIEHPSSPQLCQVQSSAL